MLLRIVLAVAVLAVVLPMARAPTAQAANPTEIETAITNGLAWLAAQQKDDGHFEATGHTKGRHVAATCLALVKFEHRGWELYPAPGGQGPFDPRYQYHQTVADGLKYMFQQMKVQGNFVYVVPVPSGQVGYVYETGICMMAVAGVQQPNWLLDVDPVKGMTYGQVMQGMLNWMADAQNDPTDVPAPPACAVGGWGYTANDFGGCDNSNTGYATLGIGSAISLPPYGFGLTVTPSVLANLNTFVNNIQDPVSGGSAYEPCPSKNTYCLNILKAGNLLYEMALVGRPPGHATVTKAIHFIQSAWYDPTGVCAPSPPPPPAAGRQITRPCSRR